MLETSGKMPAIASLRATGATTREIGEAVGLSHMQVSRLLKKQEITDIIRMCESTMASRGYEKATANIVRAVELYTPDSPVDGDDRSAMQIQEQGFRASLKIAESIGLIPANSMAPMVQQINVQGNAQIISPVVDRALTHALMIPDATICSSESDE